MGATHSNDYWRSSMTSTESQRLPGIINWREVLEERATGAQAGSAAKRLINDVLMLTETPRWRVACETGHRSGGWSGATALIAATELRTLLDAAPLQTVKDSKLLEVLIAPCGSARPSPPEVVCALVQVLRGTRAALIP